SIEKLNQVLPPERKITETERKKLQNGERLSNERYRELYATVENNKETLKPEEIQLEKQKNGRYTFTQTSLKELKWSELIPEDETPITADEHGNLYFLANAAIDFVPVIGDAKGIIEAEGSWETAAAVASVVPLVKIVNKGRKVVNAADNANNAKKTTKTGAKNTEKNANKKLKIKKGEWSKGRKNSPSDNAAHHFAKHGSEFPQYKTPEEYVKGANNFVKNPPKGTLIKKEGDDTIYYHPQSNTYAVTNKKGEVKSMYKPTRGKAYFDAK
ncbi:MAG: hypothetical protein IJ566_05185, partial [Cardiobacteriaceae bacterium]|nr:hypothetical protein [Cardiobacteriaceae bacterium]